MSEIKNNSLDKLIKLGILRAELFFDGKKELPKNMKYQYIKKYRGKNNRVIVNTTVLGKVNYHGKIIFPNLNGQVTEGNVKLKAVETIVDKEDVLVASVVCGLDGNKLQPAHVSKHQAIFYWYHFILITAEKLSEKYAKVSFYRVLLNPEKSKSSIKVVKLSSVDIAIPKLDADLRNQLLIVKKWLAEKCVNRCQFSFAVLTALRKLAGYHRPSFFLTREEVKAAKNGNDFRRMELEHLQVLAEHFDDFFDACLSKN